MIRSAKAAPSTQSKGDPTRIGNIRPSHLVTTTGIGAVVDLPAMSVVVRGTDAWSAVRQEPIVEPRLLEEVRRALGNQVVSLRSAPWDPRADDDPWTRVGVPVTPFPGWVRCPACFRLGPLHGTQQFTVVHRWGRRPDLAKIVHSGCAKQTNRPDAKKRACVPARFLVACDSGHLDDFPYVEFVHTRSSAGPCSAPNLRMRDSASTLQPLVTISCDSCGASTNIQKASGRDGSDNLPRCRGRHPHLQRFETCGNPLTMIVLGASNLWFSVTASALHLPQTGGVEDLVAQHWEVLGKLDRSVLPHIIAGMDALRALRDVPVDDLWAVIEKHRTTGTDTADETTDLLDAEWALLSRPTTDKQDEDFRAVPNPEVPAGYGSLLDQVVRVTRLREVQALVGFTRLSAPERRNLQPRNLVRLRNGPAEWVPAVEKRGEGIFLEFDEDRIRRWESAAEHHPRIDALRDAYRGWMHAIGQQPDPDLPVARTLLIHTLSHLLVRQVSLECGYSSASIRERLYLGKPGARTAGLLLSTAASDSEGTLGGLVALGETAHLKRLLDGALHDAQRCSSDPLCSEHTPTEESRTLHLAACHACLFVSETSCETNNKWLDRGVLVDLSQDGLAFPL
ncbi:DrmB family protein [Rhodococcus jostii]|uniref:DrmB family protein n=1 Tax=Rhodococcus jostii TaxID=132919 RepID=UPI00366A4221